MRESWHYQTAELVLQQFGGSAQRGLAGQGLEGLDAMGGRVAGAHGVAAHADVCSSSGQTNTRGT